MAALSERPSLGEAVEAAVREAGSTPASPPPPPTPIPTPNGPPVASAPDRTWYRIFTPNKAFKGERYGVEFEHGEALVSDRTVWATPQRGTTELLRTPVIDLFRTELRYDVQAIPPGAPPVPTYTLRRAEAL